MSTFKTSGKLIYSLKKKKMPKKKVGGCQKKAINEKG